MKVEDFLSKAVPGQMTVQECIRHAEEAAKTETEDAPKQFLSLTPSGIEVFYSPEPRRHYKVRQLKTDQEFEDEGVEWAEVPSVTSVLKVLDKSGPLIWWGQGIGGIGVLKTQKLGQDFSEVVSLIEADDDDAARKLLCSYLTAHKISTNHVKEEAGDRGVDAHTAFETWGGDQSFRPTVEFYPKKVQGYIVGLNKFLDDIAPGGPTDIETEVMVGSVEHGFAGRFDVRYRLQEPCEVTTRVYPVRKPKREVIPAGRYMKDAKTSKGVYETHPPQLAAYELASVECGYEPTDYRAVIHLTADGQYELVRTYATGEDFLSILGAYTTMAGSKAWT